MKFRKAGSLKRRKKIIGTLERPRLVIFRSNKHIYGAFVVDEKPARILTTVSSVSPEFHQYRNEKIKGGNVEGAKIVGELIAKKAKELGIEKIVFDRSSYSYTGRVKALAEAARKGGLKF